MRHDGRAITVPAMRRLVCIKMVMWISIATDAIGMGLPADIHHAALASDMKFDGRYMRRLIPQEIAQIAGRVLAVTCVMAPWHD